MKNAIHKIATRLLTVVALTALGGLLSATLIRFAPGYGVDERELDPRLSGASLEALRSAHRLNSGLLSYYANYLAGVAHGDLGASQWLGRPVFSLIRERAPVTLHSVFLAILVAWAAALGLALGGVFIRRLAFDVSGTAASGILMALPAGMIAMFAVYLRAPVFLAIAAVIFPKVFRYVRNLLDHAYEQPCILAARSRGVEPGRMVVRHVVPLIAPALFALLGVSLSMAFGAAIPMEALCDSPGVGQLAWQGALNRDLPLVVNLTLLITLATVLINLLANVAHERIR